MSSYYLLADHSIGGLYFPAGSTQSTADVGGLLPTGWQPSNNCDPLDAGALAAFYAAGPCLPSPRLFVRPPKTFWKITPQPGNPSAMQWTLQGLGIALAAVWTQQGVGAAL
jgi:hypothetical protein